MLDLNNVSRQYKNFQLEDINFNLDTGYIMGLIGPNGSGKTTLIKLIMNLIRRDEGTIKIFGMDNIKEEKKIKDRIGFVYDENYFYEELSMKDMKDILSRFYSKWDDKKYCEIMNRFELDEAQKIKTLSKGMKMKFAIVMALSHYAEFIIMDEPTSGLDPIVRREMLNILYDYIQSEKVSILFSTHITSDLDKIADYITFINKGKLVFSKSQEDLKEEYHIVKAGPEDIPKVFYNKFIGYEVTNVGFQGLLQDRGFLRELEDNIIIELPTLEDIMYYHREGSK